MSEPWRGRTTGVTVVDAMGVEHYFPDANDWDWDEDVVLTVTRRDGWRGRTTVYYASFVKWIRVTNNGAVSGR